jgi:hypothetical protein
MKRHTGKDHTIPYHGKNNLFMENILQNAYIFHITD